MLNEIQNNFDVFFNDLVDAAVGRPKHELPSKKDNLITIFFKSFVEPFDQMADDIIYAPQAYNFRAEIFNGITFAAITFLALSTFTSLGALCGAPVLAIPAVMFAVTAVALFALRQLINNNIERTVTGQIAQLNNSSILFKNLI